MASTASRSARGSNQYRSVGGIAPEAAPRSDVPIAVDDPEHLEQTAWAFDPARAGWEDLGFTDQTSAWKVAQAITLADADDWRRRHSMSADEITGWVLIGITDGQAAERQYEYGVEPGSFFDQWAGRQFAPAEAVEWARNYFPIDDAREWADATGFNPSRAGHWAIHDWIPNEAARWGNAGLARFPDAAKEFTVDSIPPGVVRRVVHGERDFDPRVDMIVATLDQYGIRHAETPDYE